MESQFAPVAERYVTSHFHADPKRKAEVLELVEPDPGDAVLDVATGTGHAALALAPRVATVVGLDRTEEMLAQANAAARAAGIANVAWVLGDAHRLPFPDASFDVYVARAAPHHFEDLPAALAEAFRVLRPGGRAAFVDCSPHPDARDLLHEIEVGRDPTHVVSRTVAEWEAVLVGAGFEVEVARRRELTWRFENWMGTMDVEPEQRRRLARLLEEAGGAAREALVPERREGELWHRYWHALIRVRKPADPSPAGPQSGR